MNDSCNNFETFSMRVDTVKKTGSNVISFPNLRRGEQTGLTQKSFPVRWLGMLALTTVGAIWALSPASHAASLSTPGLEPDVSSIVFEGEPQVVAQLMGAVVGPEKTPKRELKSLSSGGASERRVVVSQEDVQLEDIPTMADLMSTVEKLESQYSLKGRYPKTLGEKYSGFTYESNGGRFELSAGPHVYDSAQGLLQKESEAAKPDYAIAGYLESKSEGWGPWREESQVLTQPGRKKRAGLEWLTQAAVTPQWSARMYFPVGEQFTGYCFRRADGSTAYDSGELLYDGVTGTFQMKLHRKEYQEGRPLVSELLETELQEGTPGCELVGDSSLLTDLGFVSGVKKSEPVVRVSTSTRLKLSSSTLLDEMALATFSQQKEVLVAGRFSGGTKVSKASAVGRLTVVDKIGQVHQVRVRAGRSGDFDWVVGQLCANDSQDAAVKVMESAAYDDAYTRKSKKSIVAGQ